MKKLLLFTLIGLTTTALFSSQNDKTHKKNMFVSLFSALCKPKDPRNCWGTRTQPKFKLDCQMPTMDDNKRIEAIFLFRTLADPFIQQELRKMGTELHNIAQQIKLFANQHGK